MYAAPINGWPATWRARCAPDARRRGKRWRGDDGERKTRLKPFASGSKRSIAANRRSITAIGIKALTSLFNQSDRLIKTKTDREEGTKMKKLGFATIMASGLAAAVLGLAGPAQADIGHHDWVNNVQQQVSVPQVSTNVQQSR